FSTTLCHLLASAHPAVYTLSLHDALPIFGDPVLPIYVNAYLPPQPTMERCYAFGQAVARIVTAMGLRTAVVASGGMSHFPGTERDRKSTRLNSSHRTISYAVFCLKTKTMP